MSLYRMRLRKPGTDRTACRWCNRHCRITLHPREKALYRTDALATCAAGMAYDYEQYGINAATVRRRKRA